MQCRGAMQRYILQLSRLRLREGRWMDARRTSHSSVSSPANGTPSPRQPPVSPAEEALAPPPKSKGGGPFLLLSAAFCVAAGAGLYYTFYVDPASGHKALAPADPPTSPVSLLEPPKLSAQDEMILKRDMLRAELEHLRSQKRTKYIDAKKREIKDELKDLDGRIRKASA